MEWLVLFFVLTVVVPRIVKGLAESAKKQEMEEMKTKNPEMWVQLKQIEHDERLMELQQQQIRHDKVKTGVGIGTTILRIITKK